jgi:hypothetical protein
MNDEHGKLIAKVQHFYEFMLARVDEFENISFASTNNNDIVSAKEKGIELNKLIFEYTKTFETFLYKE